MKAAELIGTKPSIYIAAPLAAVMADRISPSRGMTPTLAAICERYEMVVSRNLPALTVEEWSVLCAVVKQWEPTITSIAHLGSQIVDTLQLGNVKTDPEFDGSRMIEDSMAWTYEMKLAAVDTCERLEVVRRRSKCSLHDALVSLVIFVKK